MMTIMLMQTRSDNEQMKVNNGWINFRTDRTSKPSHDLHNHLHKRWQRTWDNAKNPLKRSLCLDDMCPSIHIQAQLMCYLKLCNHLYISISIHISYISNLLSYMKIYVIINSNDFLGKTIQTLIQQIVRKNTLYVTNENMNKSISISK